jgi:acyl carrier protein
MLSPTDVKQHLKQRFAKPLAKLGIAEPEDSFSLTESGLIDSFGLLEIVMEIQDKFGVTVDVSDVDAERVTTYGGFAEIIAANAAPN